MQRGLFALFLILSIGLGSPVTAQMNLNSNSIVFQDELSNIDADILKSQIEITTYEKSQVIEGKNLFGARRLNKTDGSIVDQNVAVIMDMEGNIEKSLVTKRGGLYFNDPELINSTHAMVRNTTILLWNIETGDVFDTQIPAPSHTLEYNPQSNTFLGKYWVDRGDHEGLPIRYNDLREYNIDGNLVWEWNSTIHFPFNDTESDGEAFQNTVVWMHVNSLHWDISNDVVYMNAKGLDTFFKIDKGTGNVEWSLGRVGDFDLFDINGNPTDSLFYHAHGLEQISKDRFIIYDNDYLNATRCENEGYTIHTCDSNVKNDGTPRLVEIEVDTVNMEAHEVWSYTAPKEYYGRPWGDADRLPGGNTLGDFGWTGTPNWLTEVNPDGEIVWEAKFIDTSSYEYGLYSARRFYEGPVVLVEGETVIDNDAPLDLVVDVHNSFSERINSDALLVIENDGVEVYSVDFELEPNFQAKEVGLSIPFAFLTDDAINILEITVTNEEGQSTTVDYTVTVGVPPATTPITTVETSSEESSDDDGVNFIFPLYSLGFIITLAIIRRKRN